jgi:hypothetical protein
MRSLLVALVVLTMTAPASAQSDLPAAPDYAREANWLCLPGRADLCAEALPTALLEPQGFGPVARVVPARDPQIDCFYVYPTVSRDPGDNSDLVAGAEEQAVVRVQFARFASVCRPFAPLYRQATLTSLLRIMAGGGLPRSLAPAYADVLAAWRHYLARHNNGRPFVLIGHSQGSHHLIRLIAEEIESGPAAARMLSAIVTGFNVEVPEGALVGGSFQRTPLCGRAGETGCVIAFVSFRATNPPPPGALFGRTSRRGMTIGCTHPGRLAGRGAALDSVWYAGPSVTNTQTDIVWSSRGEPPAPFLRTRGLVRAACVNRGPVGYLSVTPQGDPADARTDRIPGDVAIAGRVLPAWGLHLADMNLGMGDLLRAIELQRDAWRGRLNPRARRPAQRSSRAPGRS